MINRFLFSLFPGSPADKADLEVADEILEINGESLENSSHTDVISHIHNVSESISLRVILFVLAKKPLGNLAHEETWKHFESSVFLWVCSLD